MNVLETLTSNQPYFVPYSKEMDKLQEKARQLCWEFNQAQPNDEERKSQILKKLFGTYNPYLFVQPFFRCDYGFNIHFHGFALINYNCVILDTSPVHIGNNAFIAPGVCISCAAHSIHPDQRTEVEVSAPITIEDNVWIGANATICGGVTIGEGSVIGAGSVVTKDIPKRVVAAGVPCKVIRPITDEDYIHLKKQ